MDNKKSQSMAKGFVAGISEMVAYTLTGTAALLASVTVFALSLTLFPLRLIPVVGKKIPTLESMADKLGRMNIIKRIPVFGIAFSGDYNLPEYLRERYKRHGSPLLRGDLDEAREELYPKSKHPILYIPFRADMDPGSIFFSRNPDGAHLTNRVYRNATDKQIQKAFEANRKPAIADAIRFGLGIALLIAIAAVCEINFSLEPILKGDYWDAISFSMDPSMSVASGISSDTWSASANSVSIGSYLLAGITLLLQTLLNPFLHLFVLVTGVAYWALNGRSNLDNMLRKAGESYLVHTKASQIESRRNSRDAYVQKQSLIKAAQSNEGYLKKRGLDGVIALGHSTGQMVARNGNPFTFAPPGTPVALDYMSQFEHVMFMGDSGTGKTTYLLKPYIKQLAKVEKMGGLIGDFKGRLQQDIVKSLKKTDPGLVDRKVRVVGTGKGDMGVDLLAGLDPADVMATMKSVMEQTERSAGEDYFDKEAYGLVEHASRLAQAFEGTPEGREWARLYGRRPYNLNFVSDIVIRDDVRIKVCKAIVDTVKSTLKDPESPSVGGLNIVCDNMPSLNDSLRFMGTNGKGSWSAMSDRQRDGVLGTFRQIVKHLKSNQALSNRFFSGNLRGTISLEEAIENHLILALNISPERDGFAGTLAINLITTQIKSLMLKREAILADKGLNPQVESPFFFALDEAQNFLTDGDTKLSDVKVINTARSSGLIYLIAFQNYNSLARRMNEKSVKNLFALIKNKVSLTNSDNDTAEILQKSFGKSYRLTAHLPNEYENYYQAAAEVDELNPDELDERIDEADFQEAVYNSYERPKHLKDLIHPIERISSYTRNPRIDHLIAQIPEKGGSGMMGALAGASSGTDNTVSIMTAEIAQEQREEDKRYQSLTSGNFEKDLLSVDEINTLPRGHAVVMVRVGDHTRKDIVELLPPDFD